MKRSEGVTAMLAALSCRELAAVTVGRLFGKALGRLGARIDGRDAVDPCEFHNELQSRENSLKTKQRCRPHGRQTCDQDHERRTKLTYRP